MPLIELQVKHAKPTDKDYPLADEKGLRLYVRSTGSKTSQLRYRRPADGKADILTLGTYPEVSLKEARNQRDEAKALIAEGTDPKKHQRAKPGS